jgi:RNA polymerase sigma-70 factor (ECF subfamily)
MIRMFSISEALKFFCVSPKNFKHFSLPNRCKDVMARKRKRRMQAKGDIMTLTELFETFEKKLHRYAVRLARDSHDADDLVQETFIRCMGHLELLKLLNDHQREAWLRRTLKHLFLDEQRSRQRERFLAEQLAQQTQFVGHPTLAFMDRDALDHIPDRYRDLLHKRYVLGMNSKEIARELDIPAATVRTRLRLALKMLRANQSRFQ